MAEEDVKCLPQLTELVNVIPATCGSSYTYEQPLLLQTWEQDSIQTTIVNVETSCSGGVTTNPQPNGSVQMQLNGTPQNCSDSWLFDIAFSSTCTLASQGGGGVGQIPTQTFGVTGKPISAVISYPQPLDSTCGRLTVAIQGGGETIINGAPLCPPDGCLNFIAYPPQYTFQNVRINPQGGGIPCETKVTIRHEGCSKAPPPGTYGNDNPPGGGSPGGGGSVGGNPPPADESPKPPPQPPSGGFGGGSGGGGAPPPGGDSPPPPSVSPPPPPPLGTSQPSGEQVLYPNQTVLAPAPTPQFPTLIAILPGGDPEALPWNGYAVYPGSETASSVIVGTTYPTLYVSPMLAQRVFHNWKTLKHVLLQFDNRDGTNIHTNLTTNDIAQYGKALQRFNANVAVIFNDEYSDEVIQELYRYDPALWGGDLFLKHYSPKQIDDVVSFKEALLGTSYSYQVAVYSSDTRTWKLVGWQVEGKPKGKRRSHSRD